MEGTRVIYVISIAVVVAAAAILVLAVLPHSVNTDTVWPLGDKDYQYDRDVGVGTTYTFNITGSDTLESGEVIPVSGTMVGKVIAADASSYTCEEAITTYENGQETKYSITTTYDRSGKSMDPVTRSTISAGSNVDSKIDPKWGSHKLEVSNYTMIYNNLKHVYYVFDGVEDRVCYKVVDNYSTVRTVDGTEVTSVYYLENLLSEMNFQKYS